jgi:hypothetical protein
MPGLEADMKREAKEIRLVFQVLLYVGLAMLTAAPVLAQMPVDENGNPIAPLQEDATLDSIEDNALPLLSAADLEDLVGPVALYPDDLLAIVLPASTYPLQVVQAARFLERLETDPSLKPDEDWDDSVTALLNYPEVIELMNEDIDWTWRLGEAVVAQQTDVVAAVEAFRDRAYAAGNLKTDEYQTVSDEDGVIEIEPANEEVIYVPYYEPESVVVYQPQPVYHYYPQPYPLYYYPYPAGYSFASNFFWGVTTAFTIGWVTDHLHVYHHSYWGHPYYGRHYYNHYNYRSPSLGIFNHHYVYNSHRYSSYRHRDGDYWRPRRHGGARPGHNSHRVHYYRDRNRDDWRHRGNGRRHDGQANDRHERNDTGGTWTRNRDDNRHRGDDNARHARNRNDADDRDRNGGRQAQSRDRGNPADRRERNSNGSGSSERNAVRFRPRNARADGERRRTRTTEDLNSVSQLRTGFAPSSQRSSTGTSSRRTNSRRATFASTSNPVRSNRRDGSGTVPRSSNGAAYERSKNAGRSNSRRQVPPSPPRQASTARSHAPARPSSQSSNRAPTRSQPQASAPQRSASPPSAPQRNSAPSSRSENRATKPGSRAASRRSESRSKRR